MNYFTKGELEDITRELIENPTRETLRKLNEKYNESSVLLGEIQSEVVMPTPELKPLESEPLTNNEIASKLNVPETPVGIETVNPTIEEQPVSNPMFNFNIPNIETPKESNVGVNNTNIVSSEIPSFELPKMDTPINNVINNEPINFTGNLFETQPSVANLMQTTDNFNSVPNTMPTTEVPVTGTPFFGPHIAQENNPIPVGGPMNSMPVQGPTMFGQLEQNYM